MYQYTLLYTLQYHRESYRSVLSLEIFVSGSAQVSIDKIVSPEFLLKYERDNEILANLKSLGMSDEQIKAILGK